MYWHGKYDARLIKRTDAFCFIFRRVGKNDFEKIKRMKHTCEQVYEIGANNKVYGNEKGVCRITGKESTGLLFNKWVRKTFNDHDFLFPGTIISNEALFCFDESSEIVKEKSGKDKPQRFRTYSHIVKDGEWHCVTKGDKRKILELIVEGAEIVCLTETGQKHVLFKHKTGMWQLDELHVKPDIELLSFIHYHMCELLTYQFSQAEIIAGDYKSNRILKAGLNNWQEHENSIKEYRGSGIFDFTSFMLYADEKKQATLEPVIKQSKQIQPSLWD
jgi:hypothetical protein